MDILKATTIIGGLAMVWVVALTHPASAQLSPGDLSSPHESLEGLENCQKCHAFEKKISAEKCLSCHSTLKVRIDSGKGLHSNPEYRLCENCHVEHQGRDYKLIWWQQGEQNFAHSTTGFKLEGKHTKLDCRKCHLPDYIAEKSKMAAEGIILGQTYLGMSRECRGCHADEHRGQLNFNCAGCHTEEQWRPAPKFNHSGSAFVLNGRHSAVECEKCHLLIEDNRSENDKDYRKYTGIAHKECLDCHKDVHADKFGQNCEKCHSPVGWKTIIQGGFDHSLTLYLLQGRHAIVKCEKCHGSGYAKKKPKFAKCIDCHTDYHGGQFVKRQMGGNCDECHTVNGFSPSTYTLQSHQECDYPLTGSHRAVACNSCHIKSETEKELPTTRIRFESRRCLSCHKDPHKGEVDKYVSADGCEFCHNVESWDRVVFDHSKTKFPLEGKHSSVQCRACHLLLGVNDSWKEIQFRHLSNSCISCHKDVHLGQFTELIVAEGQQKEFTECGRCHIPKNWKAAKFDHNRDSKFKLDGAHRPVRCEQCHKKSISNDVQFTIYKLAETSCSSCHRTQIER
ncbi:MAG: cytochrome C [candidate division Zixibacteria bacterium CG_4_9_14_3_um_filter_46_8]|nr:MAG: cytochrome C [candidate division Zixibacteria bacterium CG_4_9_14_3_um_filter_46_8]